MFFPLYSSEPSPIEQFRALVEGGEMKRNSLIIGEKLFQRFVETCDIARLSDLLRICRQSERQIVNFYSKTKLRLAADIHLGPE